MSTAWITLIIAGLLEVGWAIGIKYTDGFNFRTRTLASVLTLAAMIASMYLLAQAIRTIPVGTGYAIWTGIGALGAATLGIFLFQEPATLARLACLLMLVFGIVGLKLTTPMAHGETQVNSPAELFISGYGKGIYASTLDPTSNSLGEPKLVAELASASFIAAHPSLPILYSVSEVGGGAVVALSRQADGTYKEISRQSSGGNGPCHLSVHPNGKAVFVANYGDGTVSMLPLKADGTFEEELFTDQHEGRGPNEKRQAHAYAHSIYPHPDGKHVFSADLGCDAIFVYTADFDRGELTEKHEVKITAGAGPRHLAFSADGRFVYVVTELANTVEVLKWDDASAELRSIQTVNTLPAEHKDVSYCAEIRIHPSGRFVYVSNRGHDSIATFAVDAASGKLRFLSAVPTTGQWPRGFEVEPTGRYLIVANQRSDSVVLFAIDEKTGVPAATGSTLTIEKPACVRFVDSRP